MAKEIKGAQCNKCNSKLTYLRLTKSERVCRSCGHTEHIKIEEVK